VERAEVLVFDAYPWRAVEPRASRLARKFCAARSEKNADERIDDPRSVEPTSRHPDQPGGRTARGSALAGLRGMLDPIRGPEQQLEARVVLRSSGKQHWLKRV